MNRSKITPAGDNHLGFSLPPFQPAFAAEIFAASGRTVQCLQYLAVLTGLKPMLDDWVPIELFENFRRACSRYGLKVRRGATFLMVNREHVPNSVLGRERITTTSAFGIPASARDVRHGQVHVYVARESAVLRDGMWYPLIVRGRLVQPTYADTLRYGEVLGYPECCIRFFRRRNNWNHFSFLFEIFKNTDGPLHLLCNPLLKDSWLSYSYHMPCSFRCGATLRLAGKLRNEVRKRQGDLADLIDRTLTGPFLVLYEREAYKFSGTLRAGTLAYDGYRCLEKSTSSPKLPEALYRGDSLRLAGREIRIFRSSKLVANIRVPLTVQSPKFMFFADFHDR